MQTLLLNLQTLASLFSANQQWQGLVEMLPFWVPIHSSLVVFDFLNY
ncbi:unnamed protein product [Brassica oleracea]